MGMTEQCKCGDTWRNTETGYGPEDHMRKCVIMVTTASCKTVSEDPETVDLATRTLEIECPTTKGGNAADGSPVEGCPPRQAAGCSPEENPQATGHFQKHIQEVRRLACSAHQPYSQMEYPISKSAQFQRTFSLDNDSDNTTALKLCSAVVRYR